MHDLNWGFDHGHQATELRAFNISSSMISNEHVHGFSNPPNRLLQNLNFVGCQNIRKVHIPPMAHCWNLLYLNLSLSANFLRASFFYQQISCFLEDAVYASIHPSLSSQPSVYSYVGNDLVPSWLIRLYLLTLISGCNIRV